MSQITIQWVLTHDPIELFEEAARRFAELVAELSAGEMAVEVLTPTEYGDKIGSSHRPRPSEVAQRVASGELQMSQTYSTVLGKLHPKLWVLDLPFLFDSHEHAAGVLDGALGRGLLEGLCPHNLRGLAFTYSGGYRIISSTGRQLHGLEDFDGMHVRTSFNPVVRALFEQLGATPHPAQLQAIPELTAAGTIEAGESTWPRYWDMGHAEVQTTVNDTGHSLFLTSLVVNETFYQSLRPGLRDVLHEAALVTAQMERDKSVRDAEAARQAFVAQGGDLVCMEPEQLERLRALASPIWAQFEPRFGADLIESIHNFEQRAVA